MLPDHEQSLYMAYHGKNQRIVGQQTIGTAVGFAGMEIFDGERKNINAGSADVTDNGKVACQAANVPGMLLKIVPSAIGYRLSVIGYRLFCIHDAILT